MIGQVPSVLTSGLYAIPALVGAAIVVLVAPSQVLGIPVALVAATICFLIRMAGVRFKLEAPKASGRPGAPQV